MDKCHGAIPDIKETAEFLVFSGMQTVAALRGGLRVPPISHRDQFSNSSKSDEKEWGGGGTVGFINVSRSNKYTCRVTKSCFTILRIHFITTRKIQEIAFQRFQISKSPPPPTSLPWCRHWMQTGMKDDIKRVHGKQRMYLPLMLVLPTSRPPSYLLFDH